MKTFIKMLYFIKKVLAIVLLRYKKLKIDKYSKQSNVKKRSKDQKP